MDFEAARVGTDRQTDTGNGWKTRTTPANCLIMQSQPVDSSDGQMRA